METAQYALIFSGLSLMVALSNLFFNHLRPPRIRASYGECIHLYHPRDGGTAMYVPVFLRNIAPARGMVRNVMLSIKNPEGKIYNLLWRRTAEITSDNRYIDGPDAAPFFVDGNSVHYEVFWFYWPEGSQMDLLFKEGEYHASLFVWTKNRKKPNLIIRQGFSVVKEAEEHLAECKSKKSSTTWITPFDSPNVIAFSPATESEEEWWDTIQK